MLLSRLVWPLVLLYLLRGTDVEKHLNRITKAAARVIKVKFPGGELDLKPEPVNHIPSEEIEVDLGREADPTIAP